MFANTTDFKSTSALKRTILYCQNQDHPNHGPKGYIVGKMHSAHPSLTPENFSEFAERMARHISSTNKTGAPLKNIATLHVVRSPYESHMTARERGYFVRRYIREVAPDGLAVYNEHHNPLHGSDDFNIFFMCSSSLSAPRTRRISDVNPIWEAWRTADRIHDRLNDRRRALRLRHIPTMLEIQRENAKERRGENLEEQLAALPGTLTLKNLRESIESLGHQIVRYNAQKNYLSIRFQGAKPLAKISDLKKRKKSKRGARMVILTLLAEVERIRSYKKGGVSQGQRSKLATFNLPKDREIQRIKDKYESPRVPRPSPSPEPPEAPARSR